jgi:hypothetical protein
MTFSKLVRRTHMYLALFLFPWMLGYAISTFAMNHRWTGGPPRYVVEREQVYETRFPPETPPREIARQILVDLKLDGTHSVQGTGADGRLTISRLDLVTPRRVIYTAADRKLLIERVEFQSGALLSRFHRRRGYQQAYAPDRMMAVSVDGVIVALVFWAISGLWMWWGMRATRVWGFASMVAGIAIFVLLVSVL